MNSLYKYLPAKYVESFIREGAVLFRPLSYFRDYEDAQIRGDEFEGTRIHCPSKGLEILLIKTQQKVILPHSFESTVNEEDIFVFCLSTLFSANIAAQFQADACIEIKNVSAFIAAIRNALARRPSIKSKDLYFGPINYYSPEQTPIVDWALPERITMSKHYFYAAQQEYRIAFAVNDAFRVENTRLRLVLPNERKFPHATVYPERLLKLGNLAKLCKVHYFNTKA